MTDIKHVIIGCGDIGRRIVKQLLANGEPADSILGLMQTSQSAGSSTALGINVRQIELDQANCCFDGLEGANIYYLVPPQKTGFEDARSRAVLSSLSDNEIIPKKIVLISTTGVYGDCNGDWVSEKTMARPQTDRGKRRLDAEQQWTGWCAKKAPLVTLRVPSIYAHSRIPRQRIEQGIPVVNAEECGFTNRIHADDLAGVVIAAMVSSIANETYNVTDGSPGKITEYLQAATQILGLPVLPVISMQQASDQLSQGMLSYLGESRRISNKKMLDELNIQLRYPNFRDGLKFG